MESSNNLSDNEENLLSKRNIIAQVSKPNKLKRKSVNVAKLLKTKKLENSDESQPKSVSSDESSKSNK